MKDFTKAPQFQHQLDAFSSVATDLSIPFNGTIVRLPLRTPGAAEKSNIKKTSTSPEEISRLFKQFAREELYHALLFLRHISSIELREVDIDGTDRLIARASIQDAEHIAQLRSFSPQSTMTVTPFIVCLEIEHGDGTIHYPKWRIVHAIETANQFATLIGGDITKIVSQLVADKLFPHVALAAPIGSGIAQGRLFTLLPLPITTGFPVHINSVFALTQDRQNMRKKDAGLMEGSRDQYVELTIALKFS